MTTAIQISNHSLRNMNRTRFFAAVAAFFATAMFLFANASPAQAGCGCGKPVAPRDGTWPPYGHPTQTKFIMISADAISAGFKFQKGVYSVNFSGERRVYVDNSVADVIYLLAPYPSGMRAGNKQIKISGPGISGSVIVGSLFVLPTPIVFPDSHTLPLNEQVVFQEYVSVHPSGTNKIYFTLDLPKFRDAATFCIDLPNLPFRFRGDDESIEFYDYHGVKLNKPGLSDDLNDWITSTVLIDGPMSSYQPYYTPVIVSSESPHSSSDILCYARHEFRTWARDHENGRPFYVSDPLHIFHGMPPITPWMYDSFITNNMGTLEGIYHADHDHVVMIWNGSVANNAPIPSTLKVQVVLTRYNENKTLPSPLDSL